MRKTVKVQLVDDGQALEFEITQMSATQKERWLLKAVLLLAASAGSAGLQLSSGLSDDEEKKAELSEELGKKGLGIFNGITYEKVQPLLDDLLECCAFVNGNARLVCTPTSVDGYISDFKTLYRLRMESFKVNFPDFFTMMTKKKKTEEKAELGEESPSPQESDKPLTIKAPRVSPRTRT